MPATADQDPLAPWERYPGLRWPDVGKLERLQRKVALLG